MLRPSRELLGCNAKIDAGRLLKIAGMSSLGALGNDSSQVRIGAEVLLQSVDTVYPFNNDIEVFVAASLSHCANDIICGGNLPSAATFAFGVGEYIDDDEALRISSLMISALSDASISLTNCHTYNAANTSITLTLTSLSKANLNTPEAEPFYLYLTKPLGFSLVSYVDGAGEKGSYLYRGVTGNNLQLVELISDYCNSYSTDISGYGLLGHTIIAAIKYGLKIDLSSSLIPVLGRVNDIFKKDGPTCSSIENVRVLSDYLEVFSGVDDGLVYPFFNGETNGPLLLAVNTSDVDAFEKAARESQYQIFQIGSGVNNNLPKVNLRK